MLTKLLPNGTLDPGFGNNGYAFISVADLVLPGQTGLWPVAAGILPDFTGRFWLLMQGAGGNGATGIFLLRVNADGAIDRTIGVNGVINLSYGEPGIYHHCGGQLNKFVATSLGKMLILCTESRSAPGSQVSRLLRVNANGSLDASFGINGEVTFPGYLKLARLTDFVELPDGSLVGTGPRLYGPGGVVLQKITALGAPFPGFGVAGTVEIPNPVSATLNCDDGYRIVTDGSRLVRRASR